VIGNVVEGSDDTTLPQMVLCKCVSSKLSFHL